MVFDIFSQSTFFITRQQGIKTVFYYVLIFIFDYYYYINIFLTCFNRKGVQMELEVSSDWLM